MAAGWLSVRAKCARSISAGVWMLCLSAMATVAKAGNDDGILLGNDAALTAGAVVASVNDGSALWYNPAGLALSDKESVDVGATAFALRRYNMPRLISADGGSGGNASFTEVVSIPSALTYVRRFNNDFVGGLGLFASQLDDYALRTSLKVPIGTVVDGSFVSIDGDIKAILTNEAARYHLSAGLAGRLPRGFSIGASWLGDYYDESSLQQGSQTYSVFGKTVTQDANMAFVQTKILGFHFRGGVVYEPTSSVRLGLSIQSPGFYFYRSGRVTALATRVTPDASGNLQLETESADATLREVSLGVYSPLRVRLGGSLDVAGGTISLEGDVQSKLDNEELGVHRRASWNLRAGARFPISSTLHVGAGVFTDRGAERKDALGAGNIDYYGATFGGQYDNVRWLAGDDKPGAVPTKRAGLTFSSTVALRYAYGKGKLAGQSLQAPDFAAVPEAVSISAHELTLHLGSGVYF